MGLPTRIPERTAQVFLLRHASPPIQRLNGQKLRPGPFLGLDVAGREEILASANTLRANGVEGLDVMYFGRARRQTDSVRAYQESLQIERLVYHPGAEDVDRHLPDDVSLVSEHVRSLRRQAANNNYLTSPDGRVAANVVRLLADLQDDLRRGHIKRSGVLASGTPIAYALWFLDHQGVLERVIEEPSLLGTPGFTPPLFEDLERMPEYALQRGGALELTFVNGQYSGRNRVNTPISNAASAHNEL